MAKRAIRIYVPEEVVSLLPSPEFARLSQEDALALVVAHARGSLALSDDERAHLQAEWANKSAVVYVSVPGPVRPAPSRA
jgi:hypothetical protein